VRYCAVILFVLLLLLHIKAHSQYRQLHFDFYGDTINMEINRADTTAITGRDAVKMVKEYEERFTTARYQLLADTLLQYKKNHQTDDWIYYQLIRKTAQEISPKQSNYERYTVLKWFLLTRSGYNATLKYGAGRLLFYVQTDDIIFNIPFYYKNNRQYVCLNYHDYGFFDMKDEQYEEINSGYNNDGAPFSYKVTRIPEGKNSAYVDKELRFNYYESINHFTVKLNPSIQQMFANYPVVDYESYFNIPLSRQTYQSLIPALKKHTAGMKVKKGVDFLMRFTRYAFLFEPDSNVYGREKRLSPEQTLLYQASDCEDRAALFFFLVKEIYNLPMIVLSYPEHVTIAVQLKKPVGRPVIYNGKEYTVAEPTPQKDDIGLGKVLPSLEKTPFEVVYVYDPEAKK
jgi:hypothetical protein